MKFSHHLLTEVINEKSDDIEILAFIKKNCAPFLKELSKSKKIDGLFRGLKDTSLVVIKKPRPDRTPKDTSEEWQRYIDVGFKKKFGIELRKKSVFCTGKQSTASSYGHSGGGMYLILPIGKYEIYWSKEYTDLYTDVLQDNEDFDEWSAENDYDNYYGQGGEGSWYSSITNETYDDNDRGAVADEIYDDMWRDYKEFDEEYEGDEELWYKKHSEDPPEQPEEGYYDIEQSLEWEPAMSKEDYVDSKEEEHREEVEEAVDLAIDTYQKGNIHNAISSDNEIMLICNSYIAIHYSEYLLILNDIQLNQRLDRKELVGNRILYYIIKNGGNIVDPRQKKLPFM